MLILLLNRSLLSIVILALVLVACAHSEPLSNYCLSEIKQKYKSSTLYARTTTTQITVTVENGNTFDISKLHNNYLSVNQRGNKKNLQKIEAKQYGYGEINELILSTHGNWLWVNGDETDYVALLKTYKTSIELEKMIPLPKVYSKPCSFLEEWLGNCLQSQGYYSYVLDRVFITGHNSTLFGNSNLSTYEIIGKTVKLLRTNQAISSILVDWQQQYPQRLIEISNPRGVVFRDINQNDIFYDGEHFTTLKKCSS
ncbi:hypothetical protein [Tolypothrix tenuis]